jgi:hypothetical protein
MSRRPASASCSTPERAEAAWARSTGISADSMSGPTGCCVAGSRTIVPSAGPGVVPSMPASASAAELAQWLWQLSSRSST